MSAPPAPVHGPGFSLSTTTWAFIGPGSQSIGGNVNLSVSGRITSVAAHPTDANTIYIAAAGGGVWKTTNATFGGTSLTWTPLTDFQTTLSMGAIAIAPSNPSVIYAGTGEPNNSKDSNYGRGILVSTDGGSTWTLRQGPGNIFNRMATSAIAVSPVDANTAYAAMASGTENGLFGIPGVYKTSDGGVTWTNTTGAITTNDPYTDVKLDLTSSSTVYVAIGRYNGSSNNGVYKSTNGGSSWTKLPAPDGFTDSTVGRISIAVSRSNSAVLYVTTARADTFGVHSVMRSDNGGASFTNVTPQSLDYMFPQGWYDQTVIVDPSNSSIVYVAGAATTAVLRSTNSGLTWTDISLGGPPNSTSPHVDHHGIAFDAAGHLLDGDDGGLYRLDNPTTPSWTDLNGNLGTIQFYGIGLHPTDPNQAIGGSQDNGTAVYTGSVVWAQSDGGDGGSAKFSSSNGSRAYHIEPVESFGAGSFFRRSDDGGLTWANKVSGLTNADTFLFNAPFAVDPNNGDRVLTGGDRVFETTNGADQWIAISTPGVGGWSNLGVSITGIGIAPSDTNTIYVARGSQIFVTTNHGATWTGTAVSPGTISDVQVDRSNATIAYAVVSTFTGSGNVFKTINGGNSWTNISGNLPNEPVWSIQVDLSGNLYVGADDGVYMSANSGATWSRFGQGFPNAQVYQLALSTGLNLLAAATHGRGAWEIALGPIPPALTITKTHDGVFTAGQASAQYTITVGTGPTAATNGSTITVTDIPPTGLIVTGMTGSGWLCTQLPTCTRNDALASGSAYPPITVFVNVAIDASAHLTNRATASGGGSIGTVTANDPTTINPPVSALLTASKHHTGNFAQGQVGATYTVIAGVTSGASTDGTTVTVTDQPPTGLTITGMSGTGWTCSQLPTCTRSDVLAAGQNYPAITVTVNVAANAPSSVTNQVNVIGGGSVGIATAGDLTTITTTVPPGLSISKTHTGNFTQGQTGATYTIAVSNSTAPTNGTNVTVTDTVPTGLTLTAMSGTGWTCTQLPNCTRSDVLAAGQSYPAITATVNVAPDSPGSVTNQASVSGGGAVGIVTANDPTTINGINGCLQGSQVFTTPGSVTWTAPNGCTTATMEAWGGGGPGGKSLFGRGRGYGGGGGAYSTASVSITSGQNYAVTVSPGGSDSFVQLSGADKVRASGGGAGGNDNGPAGLGGSASATFRGGNGGIPSPVCAGGGGGAATSTGIGTNANGSVGGSFGGANGCSDPGAPGIAPGGGGGGGSIAGGAGGAGQVAIHWFAPTATKPVLAVVKSHTGNFTQGQTGATYTLTVSNNPGSAPTDGTTVTVMDIAPTGLTVTGMAGTGWSCTQLPTCTRTDVLAAGQSYPQITVTVTVANNAPASLTNQATASGGGAAGSATGNDPTTINPAVPVLAIHKSHSGNFTQGQTGATYSLVVSDTIAPTNGTTVTVADVPPTGLTVTAMSGTGWTCTTLPTCTRSDVLPVGQSYPAITVTVTVANNAPASLTNQATVSGGGSSGTVTGNDPTTITQLPVFGITKSHTGNFTQGQTGVTYTLTVSNTVGPTNGTTVTVAEVAPTGLTVTAMSGTGWTCATLPNCTRSDVLAAGQSYPAITVTVTVANNAPASVTNQANVSGGGALATATANDPTTINPLSPVLAIAKSHSGNFTQGQTGATYSLVVSDTVAPTSGTVTVTEVAPTGLTVTGMAGTGWTCTTLPTCTRSDVLPAGQSYPAITVTVTVANNAPASLTNQANVSGGGSSGTITGNDPTTITQLPVFTLTKSHTGNFTQGQTGATYTLTVSNAVGPTNGTTVTVHEVAPTGLTVTGMAGTGWTCTTLPNCTRSDVLAAGQSYPAITVTVTVANNAPASVTNQANVSGGGALATASANDPTTINPLSPVLAIAKSHTGNFTQGQTGATYSLVVSNTVAPTNGTTVTVTEVAPTGLTVTGMAGTGWTCTTLPVCTRSDVLAAGQSYPAITVTVTVANNAPASVTNQATVSGGGSSGTNTGNDPTTINQLPVLSIAKSHTGNFTQGQVGATYSLVVSNSVAPTNGTTVTVNEIAPTGLTVTAMSGTGWTCTTLPTCTRSDVLPAGQSYPAITVTVTVASNAPASVTNQANVSGGGSLGTGTANNPTTINALAPVLAIAKSHSGNFSQGQTGATYSLNVSNTIAPTNGTTVTVTEIPPTGLTVTAMSGTGWTCTTLPTCTRSDVLPAGQTYPAVTVTVTVAANAPASLTNQASVSGGGSAGTITANDPTTINQSACTHGSQVFSAGTATWTVPAGCTSATMEAWGGGGNGGRSVSGRSRGAGGGGGAYSKASLTVAGGQSYSITASPGGSDSFVQLSGVDKVRASGGGQGGDDGFPVGAGGTANATFTGGNGGFASGLCGGGGGGAATSSANGSSAVSSTGGVFGGGNGCADPGAAGLAPGGGGGGGSTVGGAGGAGQVKITW